MTYPRQFALPFPYKAEYLPEAFLRGGGNNDALAWCEQPDAWPAYGLAVSGDAGVGKTHLLHVFAHLHDAALMCGPSVRMFMPLPKTRCLAIDDADLVSSPRALLHLLNTAADAQMPTLLSGRSAPAHWGLNLPDLTSRLRALPVVGLQPPDENFLRGLLQRLISERQLCVSDHIQAYMLLHLPRSGGALREAVARLERLALADGGHITRAMAVLAVESPGAPVVVESSAGYGDLFSVRASD